MQIRNLRRKADITQAEFARILSVSQAAVASWEKNISFPAASKLPAIAEALGCKIDDLF